MNMRFLFLMTAVSAISVACVGNGGGGSAGNATIGTTPTPSLAAGYSLSGDTAGTYGEAFMAGDGTGFMVVSQSDSQDGQAIYIFSGGNSVNRKPAAIAGTVSVDIASATPFTVTPLTVANAAGSYSAIVEGKEAAFIIGADGAVVAGATPCKLSGSVAANGPLGTLTGNLSTSGCSASGANYSAYLIRSVDYAPASLRIVGYSGSAMLDTYAN